MVSLLIFFVLLAILASFVASLLEGTLLSSTNAYLQTLVNKGSKAAVLMLRHKQNINRPLAAILSFDTVASIIGATGAGVEAQMLFNNLGIGIFTALFTLASLVFAEIIPKTIGALYWRRLIGFSAYALSIIVPLMYPATLLTGFITRLFTPEKNMGSVLLREEIAGMAQLGEDTGALSSLEEDVIGNLLKLQEIPVSKIMTPRTVIRAFQKDQKVGDIMNDERLLLFTRIPVYRESIDDIIGFVLRHRILHAIANDNLEATIETLMRSILAIPDSLRVSHVIKLFIQRKEHMLLVLDEYGGTRGIVTLEDALETLLGLEIMDEKDIVEDMQELAKLHATNNKRETEPVPPIP